MEWETMKLAGQGAIRHLVLTRPQVHNAINKQFLLDLTQACLHIETQQDCRVVIVRGEGPSFCSGADQKEGLTHKGGMADMIERSKWGARGIDAVGDLTPVTIAAVHGHAIGGGAMLAMACDFRIAATSARLSIREISLGISLSWHSVPNVVNLVGPTRAKEMIILGGTYEPQQMVEYGVYGQVVEPDKLVDAAEALAARIAAQPPLPVAMTKASINAYTRALDRAVFQADPFGLAMTGRTQDAVEAKDAFFAKRPGKWKGE